MIRPRNPVVARVQADDPRDQLSTAVTSVHDLVLNGAHAAVRSVTLFA